MTAPELLAECQARNIDLQAHGGQLDIDAPRDALTDELLQRLRDAKGELLAMLQGSNGGNGYGTASEPKESGRCVAVASVADPRNAPPRPRPAVPVEWPAAADFCLLLAVDDLPPAPFHLNFWTEVRDAAKMLRSLRADIRRGPGGPRDFYGAIQRDLQDLQRFALQAAENEPRDCPRTNADGAT